MSWHPVTEPFGIQIGMSRLTPNCGWHRHCMERTPSTIPSSKGQEGIISKLDDFSFLFFHSHLAWGKLHATDELCHSAGVQQTEQSAQSRDPKLWFSKGLSPPKIPLIQVVEMTPGSGFFNPFSSLKVWSITKQPQRVDALEPSSETLGWLAECLECSWWAQKPSPWPQGCCAVWTSTRNLQEEIQWQ